MENRRAASGSTFCLHLYYRVSPTSLVPDFLRLLACFFLFFSILAQDVSVPHQIMLVKEVNSF